MGFFVMGSANNMDELRNLRLIVGLVGISAIILGVYAIKARQRKTAIVGIIIAVLVTLAPIVNPYFDSIIRERQAKQAQQSVGQLMPTFTFRDIKGNSVSNSNLSGSPYIIDFWTRPESFRFLDELHRGKEGDGLKVFAVVKESLKAKVSDFLRRTNSPISVLLVPDSDDVGFKFASKYRPYTMVVDRNGKIAAAVFETRSAEDISQAVAGAINAK